MRQEQSIISLYLLPVQGRALRRWYLLPETLTQFTNSEVRDIHLFPLFYDLILFRLFCCFFDIFLPVVSALTAVERGWELTISDHLVWSFAWQRRIYVFALLYPGPLAPTSHISPVGSWSSIRPSWLLDLPSCQYYFRQCTVYMS
jgi:hypothetical protein